MITVFHLLSGKIAEMQLQPDQNVPDEPVWIDLLNPSEDELRNLPQNLNIALPTRQEIWRNHALNRMYTRDGTSYMTASILENFDKGQPKTSAVTFILTPDFLITIREIDPNPYLKLQERLLLNPRHFPNSADVLEGLLEEVMTEVAYSNDRVITGIDALSDTIFADHAFENTKGNPSLLMRNVLKKLGYLADLNAKVNESLHSLERLLVYFKQEHNQDSPSLNRDVDRLMKDANSLSDQTDFISAKINFQLEAALGMINVEQNLISKMFSMVAVFFLPPTLVAGIYGMNFKHMPELDWMAGYPIAIGLMLMAALIPYYYFKRKTWV
jgi:magnesium transporter